MREEVLIVDDPQAGDFADHVSGDLDPRPVTRVDGDMIWLQIGSIDAGPVPMSNYKFTRLGQRVRPLAQEEK